MLAAPEAANGLECEIGRESIQQATRVLQFVMSRAILMKLEECFQGQVFRFSGIHDHAQEQTINGSPILVEQALEIVLYTVALAELHWRGNTFVPEGFIHQPC